MEKHTPTWSSEILVFLGAGASAALGMPQTKAQTDFFRSLAKKSNRKPLNEILKEFEREDREVMENFLVLLGDKKKTDDFWLEITEEEYRAFQKIFGGNCSESIVKNRILELRQSYDWLALKQIIDICPYNEKQDNLIRDIYSLLDKKINAKQGIKVRAEAAGSDEIIIEKSRLRGAYSCATCFTVILFANAWNKLTNGEKSADFQKYVSFTETLARLMQKEGVEFDRRGYALDSRKFYQFSYSFVSFNFETVFMWLFFIAHKKLNKRGIYLPSTAQKIKLWLDFGFMAKGRDVPKEEDERIPGKFTYSYDESVVYNQNRSKESSSHVDRIGKFYFAHGCSNWRECPVCGRMMYVLGSEWNKILTKGLNPPLPIPLFENDEFHWTDVEKNWREKCLQFDALACVSCGAKTFAYNAPMIVQTLIKGSPTSFIEEVQRDVRVSLEKARHIVLLGYSLPPDDAIWVQTFAEAVRCRKETENAAYCSVVVGYKGERRWLYGSEMMELVERYEYSGEADSYGVKTIELAISIFGQDHVRAYTGGIPQVWGDATEREVGEILYPENWDSKIWKGTRLEKYQGE